MNATFVSKLQAAETLGLSLATVNRHLADGSIPFVKIGKRVLIPAQFIDDLAEKALAGQEAK